MIYSNQRILFVEIYVTHKTDERKIENLKMHGYDALEIDLSKENRTISQEQLKSILLEKYDKKIWLHHHQNNVNFKEYVAQYGIETVMHGLAWHTIYCPLDSRKYKTKNYANVIDDCSGCECFLGDDEGYVFCQKKKDILAQRSIPVIKDMRTSYCPLHKRFYSDGTFAADIRSDCKSCEYFNGKFTYHDHIDVFCKAKKLNNIKVKSFSHNCPKCGEKLMIRNINGEKLIICSNFQNCKFISAELLPYD